MTSLNRWMAELPPELADRPLRLLKIPGSHDSAATPQLDKKGPVAGDLSGFIRRVAKGPCIKAGIKRWAICQSYLIREALEHGIRYLDLRVAYPPAKMRAHDKDFRLIHGLYGMTLKDCLTQVSDFLKENEKEVVLLDMNHVYGIDVSTFAFVADEVTAVLGSSLLCPFPPDIDTVTLSYMWSSGYRVIVFCPFEQKAPTTVSIFGGDPPILFWPCYSIKSPWPNANHLDALIKALQRDLESRPMAKDAENSPPFFVSQGVLTPHNWDVARRWFSSLRKFTKRATPRVLQWISELSDENKDKINIVILDFVDDNTSASIISLNKIKPSEEWGTARENTDPDKPANPRKAKLRPKAAGTTNVAEHHADAPKPAEADEVCPEAPKPAEEGDHGEAAKSAKSAKVHPKGSKPAEVAEVCPEAPKSDKSHRTEPLEQAKVADSGLEKSAAAEVAKGHSLAPDSTQVCQPAEGNEHGDKKEGEKS